MQTADIAKSRKCWCGRIWAADLARSAPLPLKCFFNTRSPLRSRSAHMLWFLL